MNNTPTRVTDVSGRLLVERLNAGEVESWLELPSSLKQPFMAMVAEVASGVKPSVDFPVPGGDTVVVARTDFDGMHYGLHISRQPVGFPAEGRDLRVDAKDLPDFIQQVRGV